MVINACVTETRLFFGKTPGRRSAACVMAPTGSSAWNIHGSTWHSVLGSNPNKAFTAETVLSQSDILGLQHDLCGVKFIALDELSLVSVLNLYEIHCRLKAATQVILLLCYTASYCCNAIPRLITVMLYRTVILYRVFMLLLNVRLINR